MLKIMTVALVLLIASSACGQTARGRAGVSQPTSGGQTYCVEHGRVRQCWVCDRIRKGQTQSGTARRSCFVWKIIQSCSLGDVCCI